MLYVKRTKALLIIFIHARRTLRSCLPICPSKGILRRALDKHEQEDYTTVVLADHAHEHNVVDTAFV